MANTLLSSSYLVYSFKVGHYVFFNQLDRSFDLYFYYRTNRMYPSTLLHLARANPFSAPLFTLQKTEEPSRPAANGQTRRLAAASVAGWFP